MFEKYYSQEQLEALEERRASVGKERIREVEAEWPALIAEVQAEFERGTDPEDERMQELSQRWMALVREFTGGDPGIERSLRRMYENEDEIAGTNVGPLRQLQEYVGRAVAARNRTPPSPGMT